MTDAWHRFIANVKLRRFVVLALIIFVLWLLRSLMNLILFTFILTFIVVSWVRWLQHHLPRLSTSFTVIITYIVLIAAIYIGVTRYLPVLVNQVIKMVNSVVKFYSSRQGTEIMHYVNHYVSWSTIMAQAKHGVTIAVSTLTSIGSMTVTFLMSFILSFFYSLELNQMNEFTRTFLDSDFGWFFSDINYFGKKFINTFGVVLEAQFFIAICNTVITTICLLFMHMPQIFALALMVFIFSLVPVAGVIISLIPLSMVAYSVGGFRDVIYIVIMICVIHALEAYVLNPKFMSSKTELPIFYTFIVLLVAEHFFGTWGLIVGVPIFTFLLDILGVKQIKKKSISLKHHQREAKN
ncbi:AI-2E family transporter [Limosilactobacillus fastidiosus]|uniref:AI-2E family transporter n=1 Tax=Limosilactobacillus fastidiosus TaxID=2759855 RepID=A0A7W3TYM2_9LACO|nr:AI-2E family transporter [Limosilactobacillus fastidiosus]MBB1062422.1 AI-2E family transporter [Limosilactobacillus fastidiosus]MBB1085627.1 AI-2E family transporter [Limosilactobacillus fastidiosus]MCD7083496.1 AI-2E family transporter [Limosilactobacillus fastidiosus]MCD7086080.1 AI-2E family transporter [Limosilactobacillus fastidiosus]MCD7114276.1 AI-2E family transporter [Limosilactobacillus fastidiosus]